MGLIPAPLWDGEHKGVRSTGIISVWPRLALTVSQQCNGKRRLGLSIIPCCWVKGNADVVMLSKTLTNFYSVFAVLCIICPGFAV